MTWGRWTTRVGAATATVVLMTSACGSSSAPSDAVPALGEALGRVDDAVVAGRYDDARTELEELVAATTEARDDGELGASQADRILAAAAQVMSALPAEPVGEPADAPAPTEPAPSSPVDDSDQDSDQDSGDQEKDAEKEAEKLEKEQEKLEDQLAKDEEKADKEDQGKGND